MKTLIESINEAIVDKTKKFLRTLSSEYRILNKKYSADWSKLIDRDYMQPEEEKFFAKYLGNKFDEESYILGSPIAERSGYISKLKELIKSAKLLDDIEFDCSGSLGDFVLKFTAYKIENQTVVVGDYRDYFRLFHIKVQDKWTDDNSDTGIRYFSNKPFADILE